MNRTILLGIAIASAFIIGTLTANPVVEAVGGWKEALGLHEGDSSAHHESSSGTELYTKTQSFEVMGEGRQLVTLNCNTGDTVINGYLVGQAFSPRVIIDTNQFASQHNDPNGWVVEFATTLNPEDPFDFVIVCAEGSLPEN